MDFCIYSNIKKQVCETTGISPSEIFSSDPDYPSTEKAFRHFLADMYGFGIAINWEDML